MSDLKSKLLLVDDDPAMLRMISKWLELAGYDVTCASDGCEAMEAIEKDCPRILLTDWEMPRMNGLELCQWLRYQDLPHYVYTIFVTVRSSSVDMVRGLEAGADDFIKKPIDRDELLARLQTGIRVLELENRLNLIAMSDSLTGLKTQRTFYMQMRGEWERALRFNTPLSCVMIDIDFFKRINDTLGHLAGDDVIRRIAKILKDNSRGNDIVSRYGGEEFCVLLPETNEQNAVVWAERVRSLIAATDIGVGDKNVRITASFGVAQLMEDTHAPEALVDMADQALLVSKRSGRDRVINFSSINDTVDMQNTAEGSFSRFGELEAKEVMTTIVAGLHEDDFVNHAAEYFLKFRINSAPVVDQEGKLVGILSEKDCMTTMLWPNWTETKIKDVMQSNVVFYEESTKILTIYEFLCRVALRSVVIIKDGQPTGLISRGSLLRWFTNWLQAKTHIKDDESPKEHLSLAEEVKGGSANPKEKLIEAARSLVRESEELDQRLEVEENDLIPCVIGGVSRLQEIINDLLAYSRHLDYFDSNDDNTSEKDSVQRGIAGLLVDGLSEEAEEQADFNSTID